MSTAPPLLPVAWLQSYLVRVFGARLSVDGIWGRRTAAAMARRLPPWEAVSAPWVYPLFPVAARVGIDTHLPMILQSLAEQRLKKRAALLVAVATIRAETESFLPIPEAISRFNTDTVPFDRYDGRADLGNNQPGDGGRFRGRGFVQLTGRANYEQIGDTLSLPLVERPESANRPDIAARVLAVFLRLRWRRIESALSRDDLAAARRAVNGGHHGLDRFRDVMTRGDALWPAWTP